MPFGKIIPPEISCWHDLFPKRSKVVWATGFEQFLPAMRNGCGILRRKCVFVPLGLRLEEKPAAGEKIGRLGHF